MGRGRGPPLQKGSKTSLMLQTFQVDQILKSAAGGAMVVATERGREAYDEAIGKEHRRQLREWELNVLRATQ